MANKTRFNQVNQPGQQDGNPTKSPILDLLPTGKDNAISSKTLADITGCISVRGQQEGQREK